MVMNSLCERSSASFGPQRPLPSTALAGPKGVTPLPRVSSMAARAAPLMPADDTGWVAGAGEALAPDAGVLPVLPAAGGGLPLWMFVLTVDPFAGASGLLEMA